MRTFLDPIKPKPLVTRTTFMRTVNNEHRGTQQVGQEFQFVFTQKRGLTGSLEKLYQEREQ